MGINTKRQKPEKKKVAIDAKEQLERDLRSCMNCKYFYGNDIRCIKNKKCGAGKQKQEEYKDSKCIGCPYGKNSRYCFPCMKDILGK